jgi:hypothetical protein
MKWTVRNLRVPTWRANRTPTPRARSLPPLRLTTPKIRVSFVIFELCVGVSWMVKQLMEMDEFNVDKLNNDKLQKFFDFLENQDYIKFFVWLNEKLEVELSFDSAPKFFGKIPLDLNYSNRAQHFRRELPSRLLH